tara:strand:- start:5023 stop:5682 length:660 start_codon:yes stop_codon:yes gene_type:complete
MKKYFGFLAIALSVSFVSCDKDDTDNANVTTTEVYGCIDENAMNFDSVANLDNGSCEYSVAYLASGDWTISHIEYDTEVDLSIIDASLLDAIFPGLSALAGATVIPVEGESDDAGAYSLSMDNSYTSNLSFTTEPITVLGLFDIPGFPLDLSSEGIWDLQNNEEEIVFVDDITGAEQLYTIENLTQEFALLRGSIIISQDIPTLGLYEFEVEIELTLNK